MDYRRLGKTELIVSEIGLGGEWLERHTAEECVKVVEYCESKGINILDCWMSEPNVRTNIGKALYGKRDKWYIQGHIGSTWQNGQYVRTRNVEQTRIAFEDMLARFRTDHVDLGMIHYVDEISDWSNIVNGDFIQYVYELKSSGKIRHIGLSTHNPAVAKTAAESGIVEMIMFSINPAFDLMADVDDVDKYFADEYDEKLRGISPERAELYKVCEQCDVGITVMKGFAGGRLFDAKRSPFGVALTPVQCIHYCLTRPAVASVLCGFDDEKQVEEACAYHISTESEKDYATVLAGAPKHAYGGQCTYCGHCKPCPQDIDIAMVNKLYDLAVMQQAVPSSLNEHYGALKTNASDCIACGSCETRCPFGVNIVDRMAKAKDIFK